MSSFPVASTCMAERKANASGTIGLRLDPSLLSRMREYANLHPLQPSLTTLLNNAMREWLERHEAEISGVEAAPVAKPRKR